MSWRVAAYRAARPLLFTLDAERVHHLALGALRLAGGSAPGRALCAAAGGAAPAIDRGGLTLAGIRFRGRVGLGAGFDKDAVALRGWAALGLGFVEVGTVTPRPQPGNRRPRLARLPANGALVNRMGFNNAGAAAVATRIATARAHLPPGFAIGVNIGRNRDTDPEAAVDDYVAAARATAGVADYLAVNVSSPNTPGLRDLQRPERLAELLGALDRVEPRRPLLVKLAPDLTDAAADEIVDRLVEGPAAGVVLSNTTLERGALRGPAPAIDGGLSGAPLLPRMLDRVERVRGRAGARLVIVASGGIGSAAEVEAALDAGADLVQLWTGLVYAGPGLVGEAVRAAAR